MLKRCEGSVPIDNPLLVDVNSTDFETMLLIITGRDPQTVIHGAEDWKHAQQLFSLMKSYKLNNYHPWFSQICQQCADEEPWEAIFLACNQTPFDKDLFMTAMVKGFKHKPFDTVCNPIYFEEISETASGRGCWKTMTASNIKPLLGLRLGLRGLLAYQKTFSLVWPLEDTDKMHWHKWATQFAQRMQVIEAEQQAVSDVSPSRL
jgi:hypothetical protein